MGVPRSRANLWILRGWVPPWYWPRLTDVLRLKFRRIVTNDELVAATVMIRGPNARTQETGRASEAA